MEQKSICEMKSHRKTSLSAGIFYLLTFVSIPTLELYSSVRSPGFILGPGPDNPVFLGILLEMIVALTGIGTAVALYPVLKRQNEGVALGFVGMRVLEAATIYSGIVSLLSIVTLRQAGSGTPEIGQALAAQYYSTFLFGQSLIPAVNGVLLGYLLYRSRLVPRVLPVLGFIGSTLLVASWGLTLLGIIGQAGPAAAGLAIPIALWEFSLGLYLAIKGFKSSPLINN
jgi:hypothetical protein